MSELPRVRRHTDGRVQLCFEWEGVHWRVFKDGGFQGSEFGTADPAEPGWAELFVTELPEPDGWINTVGDNGEDTKTPYWHTSVGQFVAWTEGVEDDGGLVKDLSSIRADALKMQAAVATCERYRAERKTS